MKKKNVFRSLLLSMVLMAPATLQSITLHTDKSIHAVVLAAGEGSRFKTGVTKLISPLCGQPLVVYPLALMNALQYPTTAVIGVQKERVQSAIESAHFKNVFFAEQKQMLGTGDALKASKDTWQAQNVLVLNGDMPLITADIINQVAQAHFKSNAAVTIVTSYNVDPANAFGRIVHSGNKIKIVEKKHFHHDIKDFPLVNVGVYIFNRAFLDAYLSSVKQNTLTKEFYITDLVEIASDNNLPVVTVTLPFDAFYGVNNFQELAIAEQIKHDELIKYWNERGVRFVSPQTITIDLNVKIGKGTVVQPGAHLLNGTQIGEFCSINAGAILNAAVLENNVTVGAHTIVENTTITANRKLAALSHFGTTVLVPVSAAQQKSVE